MKSFLLTAMIVFAGCVAEHRVNAPYEACDEGDCAAGYTCTRVRTLTTDGILLDGRMCTRDCTSDAQCPSDGLSSQGACYGLADDADPDRRACYAHCRSDNDCPSGSLCFPAAGGEAGDQICVPQ